MVSEIGLRDQRWLNDRPFLAVAFGNLLPEALTHRHIVLSSRGVGRRLAALHRQLPMPIGCQYCSRSIRANLQYEIKKAPITRINIRALGLRKEIPLKYEPTRLDRHNPW